MSENEVATSEVSVDQLYDQAMSSAPTAEVPMAEAPAPQPQTEPEYELTVNGQKIKAPISKVLQWASQGRDYPQKMEALKKQQEEIAARQQEFSELEKKFAPYQEVDQYIQKNPQWWQSVLSQYQSVSQQPQVDPLAQALPEPVLNEFQTLKKELSDLRSFKDNLLNEKLQETRIKEDQALDQEIKSIRDNFKDLDLNEIDETGKSLEFRVLEYARDNGLKSFTQAFKLFNHDRLLKLAEDRGKEKVGKDIQKRTKLGLLGSSSTPKKGITKTTDWKNKSYDDLMREALDELSAV